MFSSQSPSNSFFPSRLLALGALTAALFVQHTSYAGESFVLTEVSFDTDTSCDTFSKCDITWTADVGGTTICRGAKKQDDNHPRWTGLNCSGIMQGDWLEVTFYDVDLSGNKLQGSCKARATKEGVYSCTNTAWSGSTTLQKE